MNTNMFKWNVLSYNVNSKTIELYNVLKYRESSIKDMKCRSRSIEEFDCLLRHEMMYYYWCRSEHELIIEKEDNKLFVKPWVGCSNPDLVKVCVSESNTFDWGNFASSDLISWKDNKAKFDVYDQLRFRWDDFLNYCWRYEL